MSKYEELQQANQSSDELFKEYRDDCRNFVHAMRQKLTEHLECDSDDIKWLFFSDEAIDEFAARKGFLDFSVDKRMVLFDDTFFTFAIGIILGLKNVIPRSQIHLRFKVKRVSDYFVVRYEKTDFKLHMDDDNEWEDLLDAIFQDTKKYLENRFDDFVRGNKTTLGFINLTTKDSSR